MYHIHVDATELAASFETHIGSIGFTRTDFCGHPNGVHGYEPPHHFTYKTSSTVEFRGVFDDIVHLAETSRDAMTGYIEGEFIAFDEELRQRPYIETPLPFVLSIAPLPPTVFRETELHIDMCRDRSHPALLQALSSIGFFSAYLPKPYGVAQIFTAQGSRKSIKTLLPPLRQFLADAGGSVAGSIKEERVARWWRTGPDVFFPPAVTAWTSAPSGKASPGR